jgi:hypothetical protein
MKKILFFAALLLTIGFASCEKDEIGGTATQATAGDWYVTVDAVDASGNVYVDADGDAWTDPFSMGRVTMLTYNTAANVPNEMIVEDLGNFWNFKVKVACDQNSLTFQTNATEESNNLSGDSIIVSITGGKILPKAGRQNNGSPADSIVFFISFSDDDYPATYGYDRYRVSGIRYSGLAEND